ncbi:MAG: hypothetical protein IBX40_09385 [Methanosarcinales archaeon]|nr:hypothetical protein [Methanosarcinales archaeon]
MKINVAMAVILVMVLISGCTNDGQDSKDIQTTDTNKTEEIINEIKGDDSGINISGEESVEKLVDEETEVQSIKNIENLFEYTINAQITFYNYSQNDIDPLGDYLYKENYTSEGEGTIDDFYMWDGKAENFYEIIISDLHNSYGAFMFREKDTSIIRNDRFRTYEFKYIILPSGYEDNVKVFKYEGAMDISLMERRDPIINHIRIEGLVFLTSPEEGIIIHAGDKPQKITSLNEVRILVGDTVEWRNLENAKNPRYLISEDGLWDEPVRINFAKTHTYTFNETGTYTFSLMYNEFDSRQKIIVI